MPVRANVRLRFHGIEEPVTAEVVARVEIEVLASARVLPGFDSKPVKQFLIDDAHG
jgi:hypothetical protein